MTAVASARSVEFDYVAASTVLDTLGAVVASLGEHAAGLATAGREAVVNWEGAYRDEFARADLLLYRAFLDAVALVQSARRAVYQAIDGANERQRTYNAAHGTSVADV